MLWIKKVEGVLEASRSAVSFTHDAFWCPGVYSARQPYSSFCYASYKSGKIAVNSTKQLSRVSENKKSMSFNFNSTLPLLRYNFLVSFILSFISFAVDECLHEEHISNSLAFYVSPTYSAQEHDHQTGLISQQLPVGGMTVVSWHFLLWSLQHHKRECGSTQVIETLAHKPNFGSFNEE